MAYVEVIDDAYTYVTRHATEDQWDCDDTCTDHSIRGVRQVKKGRYHDLAVGFDLDRDKTYYLLYATYGTGCSFCHQDGEIVFIDLFEDEDAAEANRKRLEEHNRIENQLNSRYYYGQQLSKAERKKLEKTHQSYTATLMSECGQEYQFHVPWHGYFERLDNIEVEAVLVE